ncbi:MAG TPA: hypothetical protein VHD85_14890, partial [Terracidiphilus sp.]|nr:hypothetical protein [Terracidiphilus sp.]
MRIPFIAKQLAWRITAGWLWLYLLGLLIGQRGHLNRWESSIFSSAGGILAHVGFAPSSPAIFPICIKVLWLASVCAFSWIEILAFFCVYVPFFPLLMIVRVAFRGRLEPYRKLREDSFRKARKDGQIFPKRSWQLPLLFFLVLWLTLYGRTSSPYPLVLAMLLTASYFISRAGKALAFALPVETPKWGRVEALLASGRKFVLGTIENVKSGKIKEIRHLRITIWASSFLLRQLRRATRWSFGKPARRRAALFVLLKFMFNLAALGGISILFWALAIKYAMSPAYLGFSDALLASASRAIPGVPDSVTVDVPAAIQVLDSL